MLEINSLILKEISHHHPGMKNKKPEISIVTPSYNMLQYLKLCCASVGDQNVNYEHIIMDGASIDGTQDWLKWKEDIIFVSEKDKGMYNALNKAIDKAQGDLIGHLNCDEQYLPGVLEFVKGYFAEHPEIDFLAADFIIVDQDGEFVTYRKSFHPKWIYFFSNYLYTTTCTLFYRRKIFEKCRFDESYKSIADVIFLYDVLRKGFRGAHVRRYFSTFTYSGANLSLDPISALEKAKFNKTLPRWYKIFRPILFLLFFVERFVHRTYSEKSVLSYSIFTKGNTDKRLTRSKSNPAFRKQFSYEPKPIQNEE
jgi:glycosyltransferase involved in cell wall biosynthesis